MTVIARADIKPAFAERNIPVVLTPDANYLPYVEVAVNSVVANASGSNLDFLILHSGINGETIKYFVARYAGRENVSVRFIDMSEAQGASALADFKQVGRLPVSACYRLLLSDILTAYDKLIYLDVDVAVCRDLNALYATEMGGCYFAAAKDIVHSTKPEYLEWAARWGFTEWDGYVNTGVLVMNLSLFRREPVRDRLLAVAVEASRWFCDQDALNFVCKGRIAPLDPRWNVQLGDYCIEEQLALTGDEIWIAHFTGLQKPWKYPARRYPHLWWKHVGDLDFAVALWRKAFEVGDAAVCLGEGIAVSVIVPVYNGEPYLAQMLVSLAAQTLRNIEVICVDDGSTDGSRSICERFAAADSRFRVLHQTNSGGAVARNRGIEESKGRWLFFADADDFCRPDMLEGLLRRGEEFAADVVIAGHYVLGTQFAQQVDEQKVPQKNILAGDAVKCTTGGVNVFSGSCTVPWNKFFRRAFVVRNGVRFHQIPPSDDVYFSLVSLVKARRLCFIDRSYYYYRRFLPTSQMGREESQAPTNFLKAFLEVKKVLEGCDRKLQAQFFMVAISVCFMNFARRKTIEGIRKTYFALRDGGIQALQFKDVDDQSIDMGSLRKLYDLTKAGADLDEVLLALYSIRGDNDTTKTVALKCREINDLRALVEKRDGMLAKRDEALASRRKEVMDLRALVEKRDGMLAKRDASIIMYRNHVASLEKNLHSRDTELAATNRDICQLRKELAMQNTVLSKIDECINSEDESKQ